MSTKNLLTFRQRFCRAILICCCVLFFSPSLQAQEAELITSWLEVKQEGEVRILGTARLDPTGKLKFETAIRTKPERILPSFKDVAAGVELIKKDSRPFVPVIVTGGYKLKKDAVETLRFEYQPAKFSATSIEVLTPDEVISEAKECFKIPGQREDFLRRFIPLKLNNGEIYVDSIELKTDTAMAGKNRYQSNNLTLTLTNLSSLPKDFELALPTLELTDSQGAVEIIKSSKLLNKHPDSQQFYYNLKRKPEGNLSVKIMVADQDGSEKSLDANIPAARKMNLNLNLQNMPTPLKKPVPPAS